MQTRMLLLFWGTLLLPPAQAFATAIEGAPRPAQAAPSANWQLAQTDRPGRAAQLSSSDAADLVQRRTGGRVLAVQAQRESGREVYRVKVLTPQGEVRIVLVDAASGSME